MNSVSFCRFEKEMAKDLKSLCLNFMKRELRKINLAQAPFSMEVVNNTVLIFGPNRSMTVIGIARRLTRAIKAFKAARPSKLHIDVRVVNEEFHVRAEVPVKESLPIDRELAETIKHALEDTKNNLKYDFEMDVDKACVYTNWRKYIGFCPDIVKLINLAHSTADQCRKDTPDLADTKLKIAVRGRSVTVTAFPNVPADHPERALLQDDASHALLGFDVGGFVTCVSRKQLLLVLPDKVVATAMPEHLSNFRAHTPDMIWLAGEFMAFCTGKASDYCETAPGYCAACKTLVVKSSPTTTFGTVVIHSNDIHGFFVLSSRTLCVVYGDSDEETILLVNPKVWGGKFFKIKSEARVVMAAGFDETIYLLRADGQVLVVQVGDEAEIVDQFTCRHPNRPFEEQLCLAVSADEICIGTMGAILLFDRKTGSFKSHATANCVTSVCRMEASGGSTWAVVTGSRLEKWQFS